MLLIIPPGSATRGGNPQRRFRLFKWQGGDMIDGLIENTVSDMKTKGHIRALRYDICKPISTPLH